MPEAHAGELARPVPRGRTILWLLAGVVVFDALVFPMVAGRLAELSGGQAFRPLDIRLSYSPDEAYAAIGTLAPQARRLYAIVELSADVIYPVIYSFFFFLLTRWLLAKVAVRARWIERAALVPFAAAIADWVENAGIVTLVAVYPRRADSVAWLTSGVTTTKWVFFILSLALLLYAAARALLSRYRRGHARALP